MPLDSKQKEYRAFWTPLNTSGCEAAGAVKKKAYNHVQYPLQAVLLYATMRTKKSQIRRLWQKLHRMLFPSEKLRRLCC